MRKVITPYAFFGIFLLSTTLHRNKKRQLGKCVWLKHEPCLAETQSEFGPDFLFFLVLVLAFRIHREPSFEDTLALLEDLEDAP